MFQYGQSLKFNPKESQLRLLGERVQLVELNSEPSQARTMLST